METSSGSESTSRKNVLADRVFNSWHEWAECITEFNRLSGCGEGDRHPQGTVKIEEEKGVFTMTMEMLAIKQSL